MSFLSQDKYFALTPHVGLLMMLNVPQVRTICRQDGKA